MPVPSNHPGAFQNVVGLRAIRDYKNQPLSDEDLQAILEAGRWTGSSKNRQSWSIVVVTDPGQKSRLAECGDSTDPIRRAPLAIALVQEKDGFEFDIGRLAQNMMLAANAIGVVSCAITFHRDAQAATVLGLPEGRRSRYGIAFGYPAEGAAASRRGGRKPLDEFAHWDKY